QAPSLGWWVFFDFDGCGHPGSKDDVGRHLIDVDSNRDALSKTYPGEDRIHRGDTLIVGLRVRNADRAGDAVDVAAQDLAMAHQLDLCRVAHVYGRDVGFLEISVGPVGVRIDRRDGIDAD